MELYLEPVLPNRIHGKFAKGHDLSPLKGKTWKDIYTKEQIESMLKHLEEQRKTSDRSGNGGLNSKSVVGIINGRFFGVFKSSVQAAEAGGTQPQNVRACCGGKRKTGGGIEWYHESDFETWNKRITKIQTI